MWLFSSCVIVCDGIANDAADDEEDEKLSTPLHAAFGFTPGNRLILKSGVHTMPSRLHGI